MNFISNNSGEGSSVKSERNLYQDASDYANQSRTSNNEEGSHTKKYPEEEKSQKDDHGKILEELAKGLNSSSSMYDEEVRRYNRADPRQDEEFMREAYQFEFYVDNYSDDKIKEIISIFRNDFKPPKNLWIENMNIQNTAEANYFNDVFADDDNYSDSLENSPEADNPHNEEIDDIGYQISEQKKSKKPKNKEKSKTQDLEKEDKKYSDRIKPIEDEKQKEKRVEREEAKSPKSKEETKDHPEKVERADKSEKPEKEKKSKKKGPSDYKVNKAKDGLDIIIPNSKEEQNMFDDLQPKAEMGHIEDLNKTRKLPKNFTDNLGLESPLENADDPNNISIGK